MLLQAKRIFLPDIFEFRIETIGVFDNQEIVKKSVQVIIDKLKRHSAEQLVNIRYEKLISLGTYEE